MKKKFLMRLSILSFLLLFVFCGCSYANFSQGEFEFYGKQVYSQIPNNTFYYNWFSNFLLSNAYNEYKNDIPFDDYDNLIIRCATNDLVRIVLFNSNESFYVNSNGVLKPNNDITNVYIIDFTCDRRTWEFSYSATYTNWTWLTSNNSFNISITDNFCIVFLQSNINNEYNYTIYGYNYTLITPVYNGSTNVDIGQYYRLCRGFIGNYYYSNYNLLDYVIISNDLEEFIGNKYVTYTPTSNGQIVDIYFYVEPSMNQKGYKVVTYYNNEVLYSENEYNTLIVNSGGSSGDPGGGGSSIDLSETNNLIAGIGTVIKSGDDRIVNAIKSGDEQIVNAIRSGDNQIISAITDDSEVDSLLGEIYSSGDDINDLIADFNFKRYDNPYQNLIFGTIQNICDSLYGSGDAYIIINLHNGTQKKIYASQFYIQDNSIRFFVSSFLIFGILFVLYNYFRKSIDSISSGDAKKVIDNVEVDTNFIRM